MYRFEIWGRYFDDLDVFVAAYVRLEGGFQVEVCVGYIGKGAGAVGCWGH